MAGSSLVVVALASALTTPVPADKQHASTQTRFASTDTDITGALGKAPAPSDAQLLVLRQSITAYEKGDLSQGDALAATLQDPASRATAEWIAIRTSSRQVGFARIAAFLQTYPNWPDAPLLRKRAEEALYRDSSDAVTIRRFFKTGTPQTADGKIALAGALVAAGDRHGATRLIRDAYRLDTLSVNLETELIQKYGGFLGQNDHKYRADRLFYDKEYAAALRAAARAGTAVVALQKARTALTRQATDIITAYLSDPGYILARASALRKQKKLREAAALLARAPRDVRTLIRPDNWWTERRLLSRELLDRGDFKTAYEVAAGYVADSDVTQMEAEFHCGWIALRFLGDARTAAQHFANLSSLAEKPISISRGAYWQGRAAEVLKERETAQRFYGLAARYPSTYYGQIARAKLGMKSLDLRALPSVSNQTRNEFNSLLAIRAITQLYALSERDYARILVRDMGKRLQDGAKLALLGQLALANRDSKAALWVGKSATQRGFPLDSIAFPTSAIPAFKGTGNVERAVVYAIARQESEFGHEAVSPAGARGLMQVMPSTAKATARAAGMEFDSKRLLTDPAYNARIGEAHLDELIDRFKGSYIMTFAAYNAGPGKVAEWVKLYGDPRDPGIDPIDWVERIPYTETRNYVQRVLENVQVYRSRFTPRSTFLIDKDLRRGTAL